LGAAELEALDAQDTASTLDAAEKLDILLAEIETSQHAVQKV
jgi:hypothetical protein